MSVSSASPETAYAMDCMQSQPQPAVIASLSPSSLKVNIKYPEKVTLDAKVGGPWAAPIVPLRRIR